MQIINLLYSTVVTSIEHLPYFLHLFYLSLILLLFLSFPMLAFTRMKDNSMIQVFSITSYISIAIIILLIDLFARLDLKFTQSFIISIFIYLILSVFLIIKSKPSVNSIKKSFVINNMTATFFLALVTLISTFLLSKFVFNNGLHDEYQHHSVIVTMIRDNHLPIHDKQRYGLNLSDYYHYGWYYIVLLVSMVLSITVESALDVTKLVLFIPVIPFIYSILRLIINKVNWKEHILFTIVLIFQVPGLLFLDNYSKNVFLGQNNLIIYQPFFFQLAGITWYGIIYLLIFSFIFYHFLFYEKIWKTISVSIFSILSMLLLNRVYLLLLIFIFFVLTYIKFSLIINKIILKNKLFLIFSLLFGSILIIFLLKTFFPIFYYLSIDDAFIPFIRPIAKWGFPFEEGGQLKFLKMTSIQFIVSFGLIPFVSMFIIMKRFLKDKKLSTIFILLLSIVLFSFFLSYFANLSGSELALNKFYIPLMSVCTLVIFFEYQDSKYWQKVIIFMLLFSATLSPLLYFSSLSLPNNQVYWNYSDKIINYLKEYGSKDLIVIVDDNEYGKLLINNLEIQLINSKQYNDTQDDSIKYFISKDKNENYELVTKTDSNYLYKIR